ncbi:hypothetical protein HHI36_001644 [Cryptolaemus montrouzieri]|uniref:Uncharacterized protein n=1 Tax=Cryptolaemus montrouzieri TaxID=559131 RepID=A0ABD2P9J4_9CUCU
MLKENVEKNIQKTQTSFKYSNTDQVPFTVIIESIQQNIGNLNPMNIGKMIYLDNYYKKYNKLKINRKGMKRVGIQFSTAEQANNFIDTNNFDKKEYNIFIPARMVTVMGLVKDIATQITDEDIIRMGKGINPNVLNCLNISSFSIIELSYNRQCPEYLRQLKIREIMAYYNLSLYETNMFCKQPSAPSSSEFTRLNKDGRAKPIQIEDNFTTSNPPPAPKKLLYSAVTKTPIEQQRLDINTTSLNSQNKRKIPVSPGYDRAEHEKNLINYVPSYTKEVYQNISQD